MADGDRARFATTHWSVVLAAGTGSPGTARDAMAALCESYWYPLYAYVRRRGYGADDARDLTQAYFTRLIEKGWIDQAARERGRFRSFLLASLQHFLANDADRTRAVKRGGRAVLVSWDPAEGERRYLREPRDEATPERLFEQRWALALLDRAMATLRQRAGNGAAVTRFEELKVYLTADPDAGSYKDLSTKLGMSEGAVKVAVHRLRRRFGDVLREEIAPTVAGDAEIDDEIRFLLRAIGGL